MARNLASLKKSLKKYIIYFNNNIPIAIVYHQSSVTDFWRFVASKYKLICRPLYLNSEHTFTASKTENPSLGIAST